MNIPVSAEIALVGYMDLHCCMHGDNRVPERLPGFMPNAEHFPMDRHPTRRTIATALCRFRDTDTIAPQSRSRRTKSNVRITPQGVLKYALANSHISKAEISKADGNTRQYVWRLLYTVRIHIPSGTGEMVDFGEMGTTI